MALDESLISKNIKSLRFITGIRYQKGMFEMLNNMTYIYDPNWNQNNSAKITLPVTFFHVKSCHEVMTSEVSQKQMLFYNSSTEANASDPSADSGLINVVADNIINKPKIYKLDVIIPYRNLSLLDQSFVYNTYTANCINSILAQSTQSDTESKVFESYSILNSPYMSLVKSILTAITGATSGLSSIDDFLTDVTHRPDFNKESLETMWRMRHVLKMKMWNSWNYKYVVINDIDITKEGTEDGVYEATLTLQEIPIVSMFGYNQAQNSKSSNVKNSLLSIRGKILINILDTAGGVFGKAKSALSDESMWWSKE